MALREALRRYPLSDPGMQAGVVRLFEREESDPLWAERDEKYDFEQYEQALCDLVKRIALRYKNEAAWHALVYANYNPDSTYGRWLIQQPSAVRLMLGSLESPNPTWQDEASELLAELIGDCEKKPQIATCAEADPQRKHILSLIRQRIIHLPDDRKGPSIEALGYCGSANDLEFLQHVADQQRARNIDPQNATAYSLRQSILHLIGAAQNRIKQRGMQFH